MQLIYFVLLCLELGLFGLVWTEPSSQSEAYVDVPGVGSYKLHLVNKPYSEGAQICQSEDAHLAIINSKEEEEVLTNMLRGTTKDSAYIGVNDIAVEGQMVTVLGEIWAEVGFFTWGQGEPNDGDSSEDCVVLERTRLLNDMRCGYRLSFFCEKKTARDSEVTGTAQFASFSEGYTILPGLGSYHMHVEPSPYSDAAQQCENEDAHLAVIDSKREEDALVNLLKGTFDRNAYIGINDRAIEGHMVTVLGNSLADNPVSRWNENEPNNYRGVEDCVTIGSDGLLNDQDCGRRSAFICEKYPPNRQGVAEGGYVSVPGVGSYMLHEYSLSYSAAARVCETEQAHLAVINSKAEEDVLNDLLRGSRFLLSAYVGVSDIMEEGRWVTALNEVWSSVGFSKWQAGEPNDPDGSKDCATFGLDRLMTTQKCTQQFGYFCEKKRTFSSSGSSARPPHTSTNVSKPGVDTYLNVPGVGSYKFYLETKQYSEAAHVCENEGAHLAIINSKAEEDVLTELIKKSDVFLAYVGVNDISVEGQMVTVLGQVWSQVGFTKWRDGEPNNMGGAEDCAVFRGDRLIEDGKCGHGHSFFCEKNTAAELSNQEATFAASFEAGYITLPGVGSYRLHDDIAPYGEAARICANEGAHLAIINSKVEEDAVFNIILDTYHGQVLLGVNDLAVEGFMVTALGDRLVSPVFPQWDRGEPNDDFGIEDCVIWTRNRLMNDVECGIRSPFMCEKKSGSSSNSRVEGGYVNVPGVGSYMLHEYSLSYSAAARVCETEQAHLAVISSKAEEDVLMNLLHGSRLLSAYVGVNDVAREGRMVTVLGDLWSQVGYSAWRDGEPNDPDGTVDCVSIDTSRLLSGRKCTYQLGYFCEKNSANSSNQGISTSYIKMSTGSYNLHLEAKSYSEAGQLCESEDAHLAVVNSKQEEDALMSLLQTSKRSVVYVGVNDIDVEGKMVTVLGDLLSVTGYFKWANGEPKNRNGLEDCATIKRDRLMRVKECGDQVSFICEKNSGCPGIPHESSLEMECTFNDTIVNCATKAEPGTVAAMSCAQGFVHKSNKKFFSTTCLAASHKWSQPLPKCEMDCGRSGSGGQAFATRGTPVVSGELPWHVGIFRQKDNSFDQWCGGTLISPTFVVSAAHCFWNETSDRKADRSVFRVAAGKLSRSWETTEKKTQQREVAEILMPSRFSGKTTNYQSDIALVRLAQQIYITTAVKVVCFDWKEAIASLVAGVNGTVAGWGLNEENIRSPSLTAVQMSYVPYQECWNMFTTRNPDFRKFITADKLCAGWFDQGTSVCPGDSGGGLVFPKATATGTRYFLRGIVSVGPSATGGGRCNADSVAAFTDIAAHPKFFDNNVRR